MKRDEIIRDIHGLDAELAALEEQYGLLSEDFYHLFRAGELEQTREFIRWTGFWEAKQEREASYRQLMYEHLRELRRRSGPAALVLDPVGARARHWMGSPAIVHSFTRWASGIQLSQVPPSSSSP